MNKADALLLDIIEDLYRSSPIRRRATADEVAVRRMKLRGIVESMRPMTVRQVFYQASVQGLIDKTEEGYRKVQNDLTVMRKTNVMPYDWLSDGTRWMRKPRSYSRVQDALEQTARLYRRDLWHDTDCQVEVWIEKDALAGVIFDVTADFDVPLMVARGYASLSYLHSAAETLKACGKPAYIYHLGDYDPSGINAGDTIERDLKEFARGVEIHFERIAVTDRQISMLNLPTRPTKKTDSRAKSFGDKPSVELDAIPPELLRRIVMEAVEQHLPPRQMEVLKIAEESERKWLLDIAAAADGGADG